MRGVFQDAEQPENTQRLAPRARTARGWLKNIMGLDYKRIGKGVYVDGHERQDVSDYREQEFVPRWLELRKQFCKFDQENTADPWRVPADLQEKPIMLVTHDEATFSSNDAPSYGWLKDGHVPLRPKGRGKGIMVSAFLTPGGILAVPESISDGDILARHPNWPRNDDKSLVREAVKYFEYGKDHYWSHSDLLNHTVEAINIFKLVFPKFKGLFGFDNATSHRSFSDDALVASRMSLTPGGRQPKMRDGWYMRGNKRRPQRMIFGALHQDERLRNQPKGIFQVLQERGLWRDHTNFGTFLLQCKDGCPTSGLDYKQCCARTLLANQADFLEQKSTLHELLIAEGMDLLLYPKFHPELNFIERFWSSTKRYARENCTYSFVGLRKLVPEAVHSVSNITINNYFDHCDRTVEAYANGEKYGTKEFTDSVYRSHRRVEDPETW